VRERDATMLSEAERIELAEINRFDVALYEFATRLHRADVEHCRGTP